MRDLESRNVPRLRRGTAGPRFEGHVANRKKRLTKRERGRASKEAVPLAAERPPARYLLYAVVPWVVSMIAVILAGRAWFPRATGSLLAFDLVFVPLLVQYACYAALSSELRLTNAGELTYFVHGQRGGAWVTIRRPRVLCRTASALLVMTWSGPRLLPRFVRRANGIRAELVVDDGVVRLEPGVKVRVAPVASRVEMTPEPAKQVVHCVECEDVVDEQAFPCAACGDALHAACAERHRERHEGAQGGRAYR